MEWQTVRWLLWSFSCLGVSCARHANRGDPYACRRARPHAYLRRSIAANCSEKWRHSLLFSLFDLSGVASLGARSLEKQATTVPADRPVGCMSPGVAGCLTGLRPKK